MPSGSSVRRELVGSQAAIWVFAAVYFACYAPYTALTKSISSGAYPGSGPGIPGATLLPIANLTAVVVLVVALSVARWWRYASRLQLGRLELPWPRPWTALSGLCTAVILVTTTLAYTFEGISIVFVMLLMRGGVLIIAPVIDTLTKRAVKWFSWFALVLALVALVVAFAERSDYSMTLGCAVDVAIYLCAYLVRLQIMTRIAKSEDAAATKRYFVEEQLMAAPLSVLALIVLALIGRGELMEQVRAGFTTHLDSGLVLETVLVGALSQGVILFGSLVFLDHRENTYSVPVNRCTSILAGVVGSYALTLALGVAPPSTMQLTGAGLVVAAIVVLGLGPRWTRNSALAEP